MFFYFKQKTAYELRISDWSSDVCSSDLGEASADSLAALAAGGVAGLRFVELISQRYAGRPKGSSGFADLQRLAPVMRAYCIHADRQRVGEGTSVSVRVDLGGRRIIKNKN